MFFAQKHTLVCLLLKALSPLENMAVEGCAFPRPCCFPLRVGQQTVALGQIGRGSMWEGEGLTEFGGCSQLMTSPESH